MDNVAKALQIAGGVLLAVIIMSLVSYFFSSIGLWPMEQDQVEDAEQLAKFNLEYEIYDKKGMYGVDVISCLNKAISNNEKYVEGGSFLTGNRYGDEFTVDVWVRLTSDDLEESVEVYYFDQGKQRQFFGSNPIMVDNRNLSMGTAGFDIQSDYYTNYDNNTVLPAEPQTFSDPTDIRPDKGEHEGTDFDGNLHSGYYSLVLDSPQNGQSENNLVRLIKLSNRADTGSLDRTVSNRTGKNLDKWSTIKWKTALSDFKKRRFKCDFLGYSERTGRVNRIYFSEI